jgi:hypothetical protein
MLLLDIYVDPIEYYDNARHVIFTLAHVRIKGVIDINTMFLDALDIIPLQILL